MAKSTIFAWGTGLPETAIGIMRLSGDACPAVCDALSDDGCWTRLVAQRQRLVRCCLRDPGLGSVIDDGMIAAFPAPHSYTGEDLLEIHVHGSPAVRLCLQGVLAGLPDVRAAKPGEFTQRAYLAGKLDLVQAEAIHDLISARTDLQRRVALQGMDGKVSEDVANLADRVMALAAYVEACLDFSDEALPDDLEDQIEGRLAVCLSDLGHFIAKGTNAARIRCGVKILLAGPVNAGKSTLFNRLLGENRAIMSEHPGTTRDLVRALTDKDGMAVEWIDSAGVQCDTGHDQGDQTDGEQQSVHQSIEAEGIARMVAMSESVDLILLMNPQNPQNALNPLIRESPGDVAPRKSGGESGGAGGGAEGEARSAWWRVLAPFATTGKTENGSSHATRSNAQPADCLWVWSKSDLAEQSGEPAEPGKQNVSAANRAEADWYASGNGDGWLGSVALSAQTDHGLDLLLERIGTWLIERVGAGASQDGGTVHAVPFSERALTACRQAQVALHDAQTDHNLERRAEALRNAASLLWETTGHATTHGYLTERLLDDVFRSFCIGK